MNSLSACCAAFKDCLYNVLTSATDNLQQVDWVSEARYISTAIILASLMSVM